MSEGYTVEVADEIVGIIVRQEGERGYRFHSARTEFDALDGMIFVKPAAAERAAAEFVKLRRERRSDGRAVRQTRGPNRPKHGPERIRSSMHALARAR